MGQGEEPTPKDPAAQAREREEAAAMAALAAESQARREARGGLRTLWRKRRATSTAALTPEEAAAVDLISERDAKIEELTAAIAVMEKDKYGPAFQAEQAKAEAQRRAEQAARLLGPVAPAASITQLYERYALSGSANPKTVARWRSRVASFVEHLGHDDVTRVKRGDLNNWTAALIAKGLAKKTVADGYLPPVKVILGLAYDDELIQSNPSSGLKIRGPSAVMVRDRDLTDDEAITILRGSLQPQSERLSPEHALARRWVPWLCAYTGARVAEMTQLRAGDIRQEQGVWVVHVTPEAGSTKDGKARRVPLHPHLIEQGITALAKPGDTTPLFYREGAGNEVNPAPKIRATDLSDWVRSLGVTDPNVQPNHGWRHRFKTLSRVVGIPEELADRIQGHADAVRVVGLIDHLEKLFVTGEADAWTSVRNCPIADWSVHAASTLAATLLEQLAPEALLVCHSLSAHYFAQPNLRNRIATSVTTLVARFWRRLTAAPALFVSPRTSIPSLLAEIDDPAPGWSKTRLVLKAALEGVGLPPGNQTRIMIEAMTD